MKKAILYALELLLKQNELGNSDSKKLNTIIPLIGDDGTITKELLIEQLFSTSKNPDSAYRAFVHKIKEARETILEESHEELSMVDREVIESLEVNIVKKRGETPAHISFYAKPRKKTETYLKGNDSYRDDEYVDSSGDSGETRESKEKNIKLFLSYAHNDKFVVDEFRKKFDDYTKDSTIGYWIDDSIEIGKDFDIVIKEALDSCDLGLCLISQSFIDSDYIKENELSYFLDNDSIIPVGLSSKIDGKFDQSFFDAIKQKHSDNERVVELLKKQIYTLPGMRKIFYEDVNEESYREDFIKGLVEAIEKRELIKKEKIQRDREKYNTLADERYAEDMFEKNDGEHIDIEKNQKVEIGDMQKISLKRMKR